MTVIFDATGSAVKANTTSATVTFTIGSAKGQRAVAISLSMSTTSATGIAISGGGGSAWNTIANTDSGTAKVPRVAWWISTSPASGSQQFVATWTNATTVVIAGISAYQVNQNTPTVNGTSTTGTAASASLAITTVNGDMTASATANRGGNLSAPNQTQAWLTNAQADDKSGGEYHLSTGASDTHTWTVATTRQWTVSGFAFNQANLNLDDEYCLDMNAISQFLVFR